MTDLRALIETFPAGTKLVVISAELPSGAQVVHVQSEVTSGVQPMLPTTGAGALPEPEHPDIPSDQYVLGRVQRLQHERGNVALKPKEWAMVTGVSAREIRRAICAGALAHMEKEDGRDHGAKVVTAETMLVYLATISAVERGSMEVPNWWSAVRGKRAAAA